MNTADTLAAIKKILTDDLFDSKDWRDADVVGRVIFLVEVYKNKTEEVEIWVDMLNKLNSSEE